LVKIGHNNNNNNNNNKPLLYFGRKYNTIPACIDCRVTFTPPKKKKNWNAEFEMSEMYPVLNVDNVGARFMGCVEKRMFMIVTEIWDYPTFVLDFYNMELFKK
jgi:hypothetical protein